MNGLPRGALYRQVDWRAVLADLEVTCPSRALPVRAVCPLCKGAHFHVVPDFLLDAAWAFCFDCSWAGDMIELAAAAGGLSLEAAIARLARNGMPISTDPAEIAVYRRQHADRRRALAEAWRQLIQSAYVHGSILCQEVLSSLAGVYSRDFGELWSKGPGTGCAGAYFPEIRKRYPVFARHRDIRSGDVAMFACFDLPGRISTILIYSLQNGQPRQTLLRPPRAYMRQARQESPAPRQYVAEAGLWYLPGVLQSSRTFGLRAAASGILPDKAIVGVGDFGTALALQFRHLRYTSHPLPVVGWFDLPPAGPNNIAFLTQCAWTTFLDRQVVLWVPQFDAASLGQILRTRGFVSQWRPQSSCGDWPAVRQALQKRDPVEAVQQILDAALPYKQALSEYVLSAGRGAVEELLFRYQQAGGDIETLAGACEPEARSVLRPLCRPAARKAIVLGSAIISETPEGYVKRQRRSADETLQCNALLRIDQVIHAEDSEETYYRGRVIFGGEELSFFAPRKSFEARPLAWLRNFLLSRNKGYLQYNPWFQRYALYVATQAEPPRYVSGLRAVGWNPKACAFVFPHFVLSNRGELHLIEERTVIAQDHPTRNLSAPEDMSRTRIRWCPQKRHEAAPFGAALIALLSSILAPAYFRRQPGVILVGAAAQRVGMGVAGAIGCEKVIVDPEEGIPANPHAWPMVLAHPGGFRPDNCIWPDYDASGCYVVPMPMLPALMYAFTGGWTLVCDDALVDFDPQFTSLLRWFVPLYLRDLGQRQMSLSFPRSKSATYHWSEVVLSDFRKFVQVRSYRPYRELNCENRIIPDSLAGNAAALVHFFQLYDPDLRVAERSEAGGLLFADPKKKGILIPRRLIQKACRHARVPPPSAQRISSVLGEAGVLLSEREAGWVVRAEWWLDTWQAARGSPAS